MTRVPAILIADYPDRNDTAVRAVSQWYIGDVSLEHVADGASFTYRFVASGKRRYLRLTPPGWRTAAEIAGEIAFIQHLESKGIPLARPLWSVRGEPIEAIECSLGTCLAVVFEGIAGRVTDDGQWSPDQAREAGRLMARMHLAACDFELPPDTARQTWRDELRGLEGELRGDETDLRATVAAITQRLELLPTTPDCYGIVHFDLSGDNLIWRNLSPSAIDFDDCMLHWYVADIARTLVCMREMAGGRIGPLETAFLDGYRERRQIEAEWMLLLPMFLQLAAISELAWMTYASRSAAGHIEFSSEDDARLRQMIAGLSGAT